MPRATSRTAPKPKPKRKRKARKKKAVARRPEPDPAPSSSFSNGESPLDYCPGCGEYKPISEWALRPGEKIPSKAFVCAGCRETNRKPREDFLPQISGRNRKILRDLVVGRSVGDVAKRHGLTTQYVTRMLRGRADQLHGEAALVRAAWQEMLVLEGLDLLTIARIARLTLHATKPYWNKETKQWDFFPDHMARVQAVRWLVRLLGADPTVPRQPDPGQRGGTATIILDISTEQNNPAPDAFTIDVTPDG